MSNIINELFKTASSYPIMTGIIDSIEGNDTYQVDIGGSLYRIKAATPLDIAPNEQVIVINTELGKYIVSKTYKSKSMTQKELTITG